MRSQGQFCQWNLCTKYQNLVSSCLSIQLSPKRLEFVFTKNIFVEVAFKAFCPHYKMTRYVFKTWPTVDFAWHTPLIFSPRARGEKKMNALQCARYVYGTEGIRGFYRGLTASYAGISETMICFLIYETLKKRLAESHFTSPNSDREKGASDFLGLMMAAAFAKGCASCIAYPHGKHWINV